MRLLPRGRRARVALAGGLAAFLLALPVDWCRPWEAHYQGRPTSWWDRELTWEREGRLADQPFWRGWLGKLGLPVPKQVSAEAVLEAGDPDAIPVLLELLRGPDLHNRREASFCLCRMQERGLPAVPDLLVLLRSPIGGVRHESLEALQYLDRPAAACALLELLREPDPALRAWAAEHLITVRFHPNFNHPRTEAGLADGEPAGALLPLLGDADPLVRLEARKALTRLDPEVVKAWDREHGDKGTGRRP
jgi:hypothetical protein